MSNLELEQQKEEYKNLLKVGEFYVFSNKKGYFALVEWGYNGFICMTSSSIYAMETPKIRNIDYWKNVRYCTQEEKDWLTTCKAQQKFIPIREFRKTYINFVAKDVLSEGICCKAYWGGNTKLNNYSLLKKGENDRVQVENYVSENSESSDYLTNGNIENVINTCSQRLAYASREETMYLNHCLRIFKGGNKWPIPTYSEYLNSILNIKKSQHGTKNIEKKRLPSEGQSTTRGTAVGIPTERRQTAVGSRPVGNGKKIGRCRAKIIGTAIRGQAVSYQDY